ncbi:MAG: hypothetical protein DRJ68_03485 [Thermoprotei archaeon]|nr:MAG: hypothetical protein DRJ68_03485 [Thermoprotei archaeon]
MRLSASVMMVLLIALLYTPVAKASSDELPRHLNPEELSHELPSIPLLEDVFSKFVNSILVENFSEANLSLQVLARAYYPPNVKELADRFYSLLGNLTVELSEVKEDIELARSLLNELMLNESLIEVVEGFRDLAKANLTLINAEVTSIYLSKLLSGASLDVDPIHILLEDYYSDLESLYDEIQNAIEKYYEELKPVYLNVTVDKDKAWIGSSIIIEGYLTSLNETLSGRLVEIYVDGHSTFLQTDSNGYFRMAFGIPYVYKPYLLVYAIFMPRGLDVGVYSFARSNIVLVELLSLKTNITAYLSKRVALPGGKVSLRGKISLGDASLLIKAFDRCFTVRADENGFFNAEVEIPPNAQEGVYSVVVSFKGFKEWRPVATSLELIVIREPLYIDVVHPEVVLGGVPFDVEGRVMLNGSGVEGVTVEALYMDQVSTSLTDINGSFRVSLSFGLLCPTGTQYVILRAPPPYCWARGAQVKVAIFNVNVLMVSSLTAVVAVLLYLSLKKLRGEGLKRSVEGYELKEAMKEAEVKPREIGESFRGPSYYREAVSIVERHTGVSMEPSDTVREYLKKVSQKLGDAYALFKELSMKLEEQVYGGKSVDEAECNRILDELKRALEGA